MALKATEEWVRRRVALEEERLADVRSLFLPGSCEEKITHLGKSLKNFTRLKLLDLSRNSLISLEGIQHLVHLEKLNLYYNNIADLKEIFLLRNLDNLKELDLRLNPVSKNESDYRLFVVHMLPNLRELDDRPIRDSERKAALMHFSTDQAHEFHEYPAQEAENVRPRHPRAEFVGSLAKKYSELDKDDEAVLNLIAKCNWNMNAPARITGSVKSIPEAELHNMQGSTRNPSAAEHPPPRSSASCTSTGVMPATDVNEEKQKGGDQPARMSHNHPTAVLKLHGGHPTTAPTATTSFRCQVEEPHLKRPLVPQRSCGPELRGSDASNRCYEKVQSVPCETLAMDCPAVDQNVFNPSFMKSLLDLVDRYWNGFKSLHCNEKFLYQAGKIMSALQEDMLIKNSSEEISMFQDEANNLKSEIKSLENCLCQQKQQYTDELQSLSLQLTQAQRDMEVMKNHLNQTVDEKNQLQNLLIKLEQKAHNASNSTSQQVEDLQKHNQQLCCEIDSLKHQTQCYIKIQELTDKLQESHRALVCTNEHLLRELNEMRARHKAEVDQLHWSYIQLKKTIEKPTHNVTITGCTSSGRDMENRRR
ncbi:centrosomal protein of 72 kDa isoform X3 [Pristis pectinata]|uniref:centrosomal protein of 72 kDa isoform X3 n=1 Tax=Pristis pectinata TaxID=685728 RepID=UPI00223DB95D|nr:centrosomal protein of 72 kDa isoform X3 [Pristis pectinata]